MTLKKRGKHRYSDSAVDIAQEIRRYSAHEYPAEHFAQARCASCRGSTFTLSLDDNEGAAVRRCNACKEDHPIGDSDEFLDDAELEDCGCPCGKDDFEITIGVALYTDSEAVRWIYVGCRCVACGLTAVYGDWKNEHESYRELLAKA